MNELIIALSALGPLDGRYAGKAKSLTEFFSEKALIRYRTRMEVLYLLRLDKYAELTGELNLEPLSKEKRDLLVKFLEEIMTTDEYALQVKEYEKTTNHDVKAVEYALREFMTSNSFPAGHIDHCHFALTSEDVSNIAYAEMLHDALQKVIIPGLEDVMNSIYHLASDHFATPMLSRTHGQAATPTTFGKEMMIYVQRLKRQIDRLRDLKVSVKLNGASGNYCGHTVAYPDVDWPQFAYEFIMESYRDREGPYFTVNQFTNQIEPHDTYAELFSIMALINTILKGFSQDMWTYISIDLLLQKPKGGEVGSSAMPHKVNPLDFENAEGNCDMANALLDMFSRKLPISRLQRDLSDSTVERNFGLAFGYSLIVMASLEKGLGKIVVNEAKMAAELDLHPEILTEAYQLILKKCGIVNAYELMKQLSRGNKSLTLEDLHKFLDTVDIPLTEKNLLLALTPATYIGQSKKLAIGFMIVDENYTMKQI